MVILEPIQSKYCSVPRHVGILTFASIISFTGIIFISTEQLTTLTCWRSSLSNLEEIQGGCTITTARRFMSSSQTIALHHLQAARLEQRHQHRYHISYQVVLQTDSGEVPITSAAPPAKRWKEEVAADINRFLHTPQQTNLQIQLDNQDWAGIFGFSVAVIGTGCSLFARQINQNLSHYNSNG
ncbi:hypothetical protein IQ268_00905 [Oculatella sp. LEGE 06141]|uniref:hypothetical protein n=1 Tax=Oculatella sp. LEGE 06141 TaxID=1828648 RepID=UPI001880B62C|nr:hypothetical protein [Oculatella sp. LEGE 06141]MBE9177133.1 hypothetical protein [Oculatella sp. LEGE 06141]